MYMDEDEKAETDEALIKKIKTALKVDDDGGWVFINNDPAVYEILKTRSNPYKVNYINGSST